MRRIALTETVTVVLLGTRPLLFAKPTAQCLGPLKLSHYCCAIGECFGWLGSAIRMRIV